MTVAVRLRGVIVRDGDRVLLEVPHLDVSEPRVALVGSNGSGKSTLLRLLNGLTRPDEGSVTLILDDGSEVDAVAHPEQARRHVGFVFSDPLAQLLLPTPLEDVRLSLRRLRGRAQKERALEWLESTGTAHLAEASIYELSSGERQRVALASVLAAEPRLLILDEPTTLLDRVSVRRLMRLLDGLSQSAYMATHDLEIAAAFPRVLTLESGRIVDDGRGDDVVARYIRRADEQAEALEERGP